MTRRQKWAVGLRLAVATAIAVGVLVGGTIVLGAAFSGVTYFVCWVFYWAAWYLLVRMTQDEIIEWAVRPVTQHTDHTP